MIGCTSATFRPRKIPSRNLLCHDVGWRFAGARQTRECSRQQQRGKCEHRDATAHQISSSQIRVKRNLFQREPTGKSQLRLRQLRAAASNVRQLQGDSRWLPARLAAGPLFRRNHQASWKAPRQNRVASRCGTYQSSDRHSSSHSARCPVGVRKDAMRRIVSCTPCAGHTSGTSFRRR